MESPASTEVGLVLHPPPTGEEDGRNSYSYVKLAKPAVLTRRADVENLFRGYLDQPRWADAPGTLWFLKRPSRGTEKECLQLVCTRPDNALLGVPGGYTATPYTVEGFSKRCWRVSHVLGTIPPKLCESREEAIASIFGVSLLEIMAVAAK